MNKPCVNYICAHPLFKGEPSYTCKGCLNIVKIDPHEEAFILDKDPKKVNCKNFKPLEE